MTTKTNPRMNGRRGVSAHPTRTRPDGRIRKASLGEKRQTRSRKIFITDQDRRRLDAMIEEARIRKSFLPDYLVALQQELGRASVVEATKVPHDVVTMNTTVCLRDMETDEIETYTLVYPEFADVEQGRISVLAPVGTAILGQRVGDIVKWPVPAGFVRLRVEDVSFQPEREGVFAL